MLTPRVSENKHQNWETWFHNWSLVVTVGVNVSGAEYSWMPFVGTGDLDTLASEGVTLIRLPIAWERMQPTLNGPLDQTYLAGL